MVLTEDTALYPHWSRIHICYEIYQFVSSDGFFVVHTVLQENVKN